MHSLAARVRKAGRWASCLATTNLTHPITLTPHSIQDTAVNGRYPVGYPPTAKLGGLTLTDLVAHSGSPWLALFRPTSDHMANVGLKHTWDH